MRSNAKQVIGKLKMRLSKVMQEAPKVLANEGQRYFSEQFRKQEWEGKKWKPKKNWKDHNPTLVGKTRRLKNAVNSSIRETSLKRIRWAVSIPYAEIHNKGGTIRIGAHTKTVGFRKKSGSYQYVFAKIGAKRKGASLVNDYHIAAHTVVMPKRQFMGASRGFKIRLKNKFDTMFRSAKYK